MDSTADQCTRGALLVYGSLFLYESEERQIQNILEHWWIRIDDARTVAIATHTTMMRAAANIARSALDRVFGPRLLSLRAVSVSGLLSLASFHFTAKYLSRWAHAITAVDANQLHLKPPTEQAIMVLVTVFAGFVGLLLVLVVPTDALFMDVLSSLAILVVVLGATSRHLVRLPQIFFALLVVLLTSLALFTRPYPDFVGFPYMVQIAVLAGICFDVIAIAVTRRLVLWQSTLSSFGRILTAAVIEFVMGVSLVAVPIYFGFRFLLVAVNAFPWYVGMAGWAVVLSALTNVVSVVISLSFFAAWLLLVIHSIVWPAVARPLYRLARLGVFRNTATKSALFAVGISTVAVGLGHGDDVVLFLLGLFKSA